MHRPNLRKCSSILTEDLMRSFPVDPMWMWPISTRVNKPENDDPSIVEPVKLAAGAA
jgi:hypothetical protein